MRTHRLARLTRLTHGAALIGIGLAGMGCGNDPPPQPPMTPDHVNGPEPTATPVASGAPSATPAATPSATPAPIDPPHTNAPPPLPAKPSAAPSSSAAPKADLPKHTNSPPPKK